jgi:hypothetical protein
MMKGTSMIEYEARLCIECMFTSEGIREDDTPTHNELGMPWLEFMAGKHVVTMTDDEGDILIDEFSKYYCDGCETRLAGTRYHVLVEE